MGNPSFFIHNQPGSQTIEVRDGDCSGTIGIDSVEGPAGTNLREYFVTCDGVRPTGCHMMIRSPVPITDGMQWPNGATTHCVATENDCPHGMHCDEDFIMMPDGQSSQKVCTCVNPPPGAAQKQEQQQID